jgi:chaperonin GroES
MKYIQAVKDKIVVRLLKNDEITLGGIIIPEIAMNKGPHKMGEVISIGNAVEEISVGDTIVFASFGGQDTLLDNVAYKILALGEVYGILKED